MSQALTRNYCLACLLLLATAVSGQVFRMGDPSPVSTCGGSFLDSGGTLQDHIPAGQRRVLTICSNSPSENLTHIRLTFTVIDLRGELILLNGSDLTADTIRVIDSSNNGDRITVNATAANTSGCITAVFISDGTKPGWEADISCIAACQPIFAGLEATDPARNPANRDYIDVCVGDPVTLTAGARYPENNQLYAQSDATSSFRWTFGDGISDTSRSVTHVYTEPGGYIVGLDITDVKGCSNVNSIGQRVRVAAPPTVTPPTSNPIVLCPGESVSIGLNGAPGSDYDIAVTPQTTTFRPPTAQSERVEIPAFGNTPLVSRLSINNFGAGQKVRSGAGIAEICLSIEHTYVGDLSLWVECPDGRRVDLVRYDPKAGGATYHRFGNPPFPDNDLPAPPATYCWRAGAPRTLAEVAQDTPPDFRGPPALLPPDIKYRPLGGNFEAFTGCNLNGDWTLHIIDNENGDDGTLYNWSIEFADVIDASSESFVIPVEEVTFTDSGIYSDFQAQLVTYTADNPGFANVGIESTDSVGCDHQASLPVVIQSPFAAECYTCPPPGERPLLDTTICVGDSLIPTLFPDLPDARRTVTWEAFTNLAFGAGGLQDSVYRSTLTVTDQLPQTVGAGAESIESVCIDFRGTANLNQLEVALVAPDGERVILAPRGTLAGNTSDRCFEPDGSPKWAVLQDGTTNGEWTLEIANQRGPINGRLISWSIGLIRQAELTYAWSPKSPDFSCTDCATPTIRPTASGTYTLTVTTSDGCTAFADLKLNLSKLALDVVAEVTASCAGQDNGSIILPLLEEGITFAWSNGATSRSITDLGAGDYSVTLTGAAGCRQVYSYKIVPLPLPKLTLDATDLSCGAQQDGSIVTRVEGGTQPLTYRWADPTLPATGNLNGLPAGYYRLTVTDSTGCQDTASVTLTEPPPISIVPQTSPVTCRGGSDGTATLLTSGGTGPLTIRWQRDTTTNRLVELPAGSYPVTVSDVNGCSLTATAVVTQPDSALSVAFTARTTGCFGAADASARAVASGGNGGYTYRWSSGETTVVATRLAAGEQFVTVTDTKQCTVVGRLVVPAPVPLVLEATSQPVACGGQTSGRIDLRASGGRAPYRYGLDSTQLGTTPAVVGLGPGTYVVYAQDGRGCRTRDTVEVADGLPLRVDLGPDLTINYGDSIRIPGRVEGAAGDADLQWRATDLNTLSCLDCPDPFARPLEQATYQLSVVDALGCLAEDRLTIQVINVREVAVATGFSPNGDGRNDLLFVQGRPGARVLDFQVFDQWGGLVYRDEDFSVNDRERGWDGNGPQARPVNAGVYVYKLTIEYEDGERETRSGQTTLIR